jgi:hypothetical protein
MNWVDNNLWVISAILLVLSIYSFYRGIKQWRSGSGGYQGNPPKWVESDEKVAFWSVGANVFGSILLLAAIGSYIWMQLEK